MKRSRYWALPLLLTLTESKNQDGHIPPPPPRQPPLPPLPPPRAKTAVANRTILTTVTDHTTATYNEGVVIPPPPPLRSSMLHEAQTLMVDNENRNRLKSQQNLVFDQSISNKSKHTKGPDFDRNLNLFSPNAVLSQKDATAKKTTEQLPQQEKNAMPDGHGGSTSTTTTGSSVATESTALLHRPPPPHRVLPHKNAAQHQKFTQTTQQQQQQQQQQLPEQKQKQQHSQYKIASLKNVESHSNLMPLQSHKHSTTPLLGPDKNGFNAVSATSAVPRTVENYPQSNSTLPAQRFIADPAQLWQRNNPQSRQDPPGQFPLRPQQPLPMQYKKTNPQQLHQEYLATRRVTTSPLLPVWKRLWRKVERGLDSLADIEDSVSERASRIVVSSAKIVSSTSSNMANTLLEVKGPWKKDLTHTTVTPRSGHVPTVSMYVVESTTQPLQLPKLTNDTKENLLQKQAPGSMQSTKVLDGGTDPTKPHDIYLQKYKHSNKSSTISTTKPLLEKSRKINWNDVRTGQMHPLIRANGGASEPLTPTSENLKSSPVKTSPHIIQQANVIRNNVLASKNMPSSSQMAVLPLETDKAAFNDARPMPLMAFATAPASSEKSLSAAQSRLLSDLYVDDKPSLSKRLVDALPSFPRLPFRLLRWRSSSLDDVSIATMDMWKRDDVVDSAKSFGMFRMFGKKKPVDFVKIPKTNPRSNGLTPSLVTFMERCNEGKSTTLLHSTDMKKIATIGRLRAWIDILCLMLTLIVARCMPTFDALSRGQTITESWAPFALLAAYFAYQTNNLVFHNYVKPLSDQIGRSVYDEANYGSMFLRVFASTDVKKSLPDQVEEAVRREVVAKVETGRLGTWVMTILSILLLTTVTMIRSFATAVMDAVNRILTTDELFRWPPHLQEIGGTFLDTGKQLSEAVFQMLLREITIIRENPLHVAFEASFFAALLLVALLPVLEGRRSVHQHMDEEEEHESLTSYVKLTNDVSNIGVSGVNRLNLMSNHDALAGVLERWSAAGGLSSEATSAGISTSGLVRLCMFGVLVGCILSIPVIVLGNVGFSSSVNSLIRWDSLVDVALVLLFANGIAWRSFSTVVNWNEMKKGIVGFINVLAVSTKEYAQLTQVNTSQTTRGAFSSTAGLQVKDVWAAHATKRAWAVRGASLECRSGEVLVILGEDGAGKSRLLTVLAESIVAPPKAALTATRVRGSIAVNGLDVDKCDRFLLKKRVGLLLNDVRSAADSARLFSGLTLEEILEPYESGTNARKSCTSAITSMMLGLKITGLSSSLLSKYPSKLSTVVTANEEDLKPAPLRARSNVLTPSEWMKLLLARVITQGIYDNENAATSTDKLEDVLNGSILILDDVTANLSEIEEAHLMQDLKLTGAATVVSSNHWASGRFADCIIVMKDGAIVEKGTHAELLSRGSQQSIYAAKWHAMTTQ